MVVGLVTATALCTPVADEIHTVTTSPTPALMPEIDHVPPEMVPFLPLWMTPFTAMATLPLVRFVVSSDNFAIPETVTPGFHVVVQSLTVGHTPATQVSVARR